MCIRIHQEQAEPRDAGATPPLRPLQRPRSRWAIAGAAALVAGLAAAAMVAPPPSARITQSDPVPVRATQASVPAGGVVEQTATTVDDDVPSAPATNSTRGALGHCDHGM